MAEKKLITEKLLEVQATLKAPKGQTNTFGKYKYRSCEDILEALKPLLKKNGLTLGISDEIVMIGERYYVKATAKVADAENVLEVTAYAREPEEKKGMDLAQLTGATSSYARKYALNGMFCIDDTKDADTMDNTDAGKKTTKKAPVSAGGGTAAQQSVGAIGNTTTAGKKAGGKKTAVQPSLKKKKPDPKSESMLEQRAAQMSETFQIAESVAQIKALAAEYKVEIGLMPIEFQTWLRDEFTSNNTALKRKAEQGEEGEEEL